MTVRVRFLVLLLLAALTLAGGCGQRSWQSGGVPGSKPYTVRGKTYYPLKSAHGFVEVGTASWYGPGFHGKTTSSGERFKNQGARHQSRQRKIRHCAHQRPRPLCG